MLQMCKQKGFLVEWKIFQTAQLKWDLHGVLKVE